jgi:hypothetical protein
MHRPLFQKTQFRPGNAEILECGLICNNLPDVAGTKYNRIRPGRAVPERGDV